MASQHYAAVISVDDETVSSVLTRYAVSDGSTDPSNEMEVSYTYDDSNTDALDADKLRQYVDDGLIDVVSWDDSDPHVADDVSVDNLRDYYDLMSPVWGSLSTMGDGLHSIWLKGNYGWWVDDLAENPVERGYAYKRMPALMPDHIDLSFSDDVRSAYLNTTYTPRDILESKTGYYNKDGDDKDWEEEKPSLPTEDEIGTYSLWVDIDVRSEDKQRPLTDAHRTVVEERLSRWMDEFETITGSRDHVLALDSGGGAYVIIPPATLLPVGSEFDGDEKKALLKHIGKRFRASMDAVHQRVVEADDADDDLFAPDGVAHRNRQMKVGAHKSLDAVVKPLNTDEPSYDPPRRINDVDEEFVGEFESWADEYTDAQHTDALDAVVEYLFQSADFLGGKFPVIEGDGWEDILTNWLAYEEEEEMARKKAAKRRKEMTDGLVGCDLTTDINVVYEAIDRVNDAHLLDEIQNVTTVYPEEGGERDFDPSFYRDSNTGRSASYTVDGGTAKWMDKSENVGHDIAHLVALDEGYITSVKESLTGQAWIDTLDELRDRGYEIPMLFSEPNDEYPSVGTSAIARAALALNFADNALIAEKEGEYGTYLDIIAPSVWNRTLRALDEKGIEHGMDYRETPSDMPSTTDEDVEGIATSEDVEKAMNEEASETPSESESHSDTPDDTSETKQSKEDASTDADDDSGDGSDWEDDHIVNLTDQPDSVQAVVENYVPDFIRRLKEFDFSYPKYDIEVVDREFVMHVIPTNSGATLMFFADDGETLVHRYNVDLDKVGNIHYVRQILGGVVEGLGYTDENEDAKRDVRQVFSTINNDKLVNYDDELLYPSVVRFLEIQTLSVTRTRTRDNGSKVEVELKPDPRAPDEPKGTLTFSGSEWFDKTHRVGMLFSAYSNTFGEGLDVEEDDGDNDNGAVDEVFDLWDAAKDREMKQNASHETLVDKATKKIDRLQMVYACNEDSVEKWSPELGSGVLCEFEGVTAVAVGGTHMDSWVQDAKQMVGSDADPQEILERDGLVLSVRRAKGELSSALNAADKYRQPVVWYFDADRLNWDEMSAKDVSIEQDDGEDERGDTGAAIGV